MVLLGDDHAASRLQPPDRRAAAGARGGGLDRTGLGALRRGRRRRRVVLVVEHHQRFRGHGGVALHHLHVAGKGRFLLLVAHLERRRFDLDRLVAVLRKALHGVGDILHRALRGAVGGPHQSDGDRAGKETARNTFGRRQALKKHHGGFHLALARLAEEGRALGGTDGSGVGSGAGSAAAGSGLSMIRFILTRPSKRTSSPFSVMRSRSAVSVPFSSLTSTGSSDVTVPLAISSSACDSRAS